MIAMDYSRLQWRILSKKRRDTINAVYRIEVVSVPRLSLRVLLLVPQTFTVVGEVAPSLAMETLVPREVNSLLILVKAHELVNVTPGTEANRYSHRLPRSS